MKTIIWWNHPHLVAIICSWFDREMVICCSLSTTQLFQVVTTVDSSEIRTTCTSSALGFDSPYECICSLISTCDNWTSEPTARVLNDFFYQQTSCRWSKCIVMKNNVRHVSQRKTFTNLDFLVTNLPTEFWIKMPIISVNVLGPVGPSHSFHDIFQYLFYTHLTNRPWNKSLNFIFPTKYVIPKSLKV